eukprot:3246498-Pyramimonas_sp.AAC.1
MAQSDLVLTWFQLSPSPRARNTSISPVAFAMYACSSTTSSIIDRASLSTSSQSEGAPSLLAPMARLCEPPPRTHNSMPFHIMTRRRALQLPGGGVQFIERKLARISPSVAPFLIATPAADDMF